LVELGDLDELVRHVDRLVDGREWPGLVDLHDRCRRALARGKQLWPIASLVEYRLALEAPGEWAAQMLTDEHGRFTLGPLPEVAASTHQWSELAPHLVPGPLAVVFAHERVVRGEDLAGVDLPGPPVLDLPLTLAPWEPSYPLATYRSFAADFPTPQSSNGAPAAHVVPGPGGGTLRVATNDAPHDRARDHTPHADADAAHAEPRNGPTDKADARTPQDEPRNGPPDNANADARTPHAEPRNGPPDNADARTPQDDPAARALAGLARTWITESNGRVDAVAVAGDAVAAIHRIAPVEVRVTPIEPADALADMAWTAASGGAHGRRRGMAAGRFEAWWTAVALCGFDEDEPVEPDQLGQAVAELRWYRWDAMEPATGWELRLAVEDPDDGLAWAVAATDASL
jgi:hypothetical protein